MTRTFITMLIYLLIGCYYADSQTVDFVDNLAAIMEELGIEEDETNGYEELYDDLSLLLQHPLELNKATVEELQKIPFLTNYQVEEIIQYRERYGDFVSIYELKNIETLDISTSRMLSYFVYINEKSVDNRLITVNNLLKYGRNELVARYNTSFQQKKGYQPLPDSLLQSNPNKKYLGEPFYHSIRYTYTYDTKVQVGILVEKDAGEPFLNTHHKGYDYYSGHVVIKDINRLLKTVVIGDYKASFGQGLVMSQDYTPGRTAIVAQADRRKNGFRRHFSTNEYDYLRGVATTVSFSPITINLGISSRQMDGIIDSCYIRSIKKDGLHRTERERERKHVFPLNMVCGNIRYSTYSLSVGFTTLFTSFGKYELYPEEKPYNLYYFRGNSNLNMGVDYLWKKRGLKLFGEIAHSKGGNMALLQGIQFIPASYINILALYRYYDKQYNSYYAKAFSQQSEVRNEEGFYLGISFTPIPYWKLSTYADLYRFPWLKYGVDAPSYGKEYMVQVDHTFSSSLSCYLRYRYRGAEKNNNSEAIRTIQSYAQQKIQFQMKMESDIWTLRTSGEYGYYSFTDNKDKGYMLAQSIGYKYLSRPVRMDLYGGWFKTDSYSVRFRSFERTLLYDFYSPMVYGKGFRLSAVVQWEIIKRLFLTIKLASTRYSDRETIGSGLEEIDGNKKGDIYLQMRWKF